MLHAGADINMHYYKLRNVSFEDGAINGTLTFKQPLAVSSDGTLSKWSTATLTFKNGILISGAYTCDYLWWNAGITAVALVGGSCSDGDVCGADCLNLNASAGSANWNIGASVFLEQPIAA